MKLYRFLFEGTSDGLVYQKFSKSDVELEGSAKLDKDCIVLTDDYHQDGKATLKPSVDLHDRSWKAEIVFEIDNSAGVEDAEGKGADGISINFGGTDKLVVNFDTFKNLENDSGNEVLLRVETSVVEKKYVRGKMNDGKQHHFRIHYNNDEQIISVHEIVHKKDGKIERPILSYAFSEYPLGELLKGDMPISFSGFTGDGKGIHRVRKFGIQYS